MAAVHICNMYVKNAMNFRFQHFAQQNESIDHTHCFYCKVNGQVKKLVWCQKLFLRSIIGLWRVVFDNAQQSNSQIACLFLLRPSFSDFFRSILGLWGNGTNWVRWSKPFWQKGHVVTSWTAKFANESSTHPHWAVRETNKRPSCALLKTALQSPIINLKKKNVLASASGSLDKWNHNLPLIYLAIEFGIFLLKTV